MATLVIGLVIEAMRKMASVCHWFLGFPICHAHRFEMNDLAMASHHGDAASNLAVIYK